MSLLFALSNSLSQYFGCKEQSSLGILKYIIYFKSENFNKEEENNFHKCSCRLIFSVDHTYAQHLSRLVKWYNWLLTNKISLPLPMSESFGLFLTLFSSSSLFVLWGDVGACSVVCSDSPLTPDSSACCRECRLPFHRSVCVECQPAAFRTSQHPGRDEGGRTVSQCGCYNAYFIFSFSLWFFFVSRLRVCSESGTETETTLAEKGIEEWECDSVWKCLCEEASNEYNFNFWVKSCFPRGQRVACKYVGEQTGE